MKLICTALLLFSLHGANAQRWKAYDVRNLEQYESALQQARANEQMLFIVVHRGEVFNDMIRGGYFKNEELQQSLANYFAMAVEESSDMGRQLLATFQTGDDRPLFLFMTNDELLITQLEGLNTAVQLEKAAHQSRMDKEKYQQILAARTQRDLRREEWLLLLKIQSLNFPFERTQREAQFFFNAIPEWFSYVELLTNTDHSRASEQDKAADYPHGSIVKLLQTYALDWETGHPQWALKNRKGLEKLSAGFEAIPYFKAVYSFNFDRIVFSKDSISLKKWTDEFIPLHPDEEADQALLRQATYENFAEKTGLFQFYGRYWEDYLPKGTPDEERAEKYFNTAYQLAETHEEEAALQASLKITEKAIRLNPQFKYRLMAGYVSYLLENKEKSMHYIEAAIQNTANRAELDKAMRLRDLVEREL